MTDEVVLTKFIRDFELLIIKKKNKEFQFQIIIKENSKKVYYENYDKYQEAYSGLYKIIDHIIADNYFWDPLK